jgi:hypothetical protein
MNAECQNCSMVVADEDLKEIRHLSERVAPGEPMPSGECPYCGAVAHPTDKEVSRIKLRVTIDVVFTPHGETAQQLMNILKGLGDDANDEGKLSGESNAEVDSYKVKVEEVQ